MPDLLLEILSEEIPARMQARAAADLSKLVTDALVAQGFLYEGAKALVTPRRLALHVAGLPAAGKDVREEKRGPRVGAPEEAMKGFLKSAGVSSAEQVRIVSDPKKGDFYVATIERPGRPTPQVLSEILPGIIRAFPWPKSMRWGAASAEPGALRWVRPLQSILCTFGSDTETPEIVPLVIDGIVSGDTTRGHRFMAPAPIQVRRFDDYVAALQKAKVVADPERRRDIIRHDARDLAFAQGLEVVEDEGLLDEVAGLVEWPVVLMGSFDESFLAIPPEVIRATIRANQKCFVLRRQGDAGALANRFILVSNIEARDGGAAIVAGNERVVRARLSDAKFFWETDKKTKLEDRLPKLASIVFHEKLGTQAERVERIAALARELAPVTGADPDQAERAARLAKADLVTEMVGEFPELQGLMGRYYATAQGEPPSVAAAIEDHYKPVGPSDRVPTDPVSVAVALADKLDTLVGFWAIGETPTGSKDPYALRRAALGVIRLVLENGLRLRILSLISRAVAISIGRSTTFYPFFQRVSARYENPVPDVFAEELRKEADRRFWWRIASRPTETARLIADTYRDDAPFNEGAWLKVMVGLDAMADIYELENGLECPSVDEAVTLYDLSRDKAFNAVWQMFSRYIEPLQIDLLAFFHHRLKVYLRDRGARHDLIDAVLAANAAPASPLAGEVAAERPERGRAGGTSPAGEAGGTPPTPGPSPRGGGEGVASGGSDDLLMVVRRVEALGRFLETENGKNLLAATKRAANILRIEEKKDARSYDDMPDLAALVANEEKALAVALARAAGAASEAVAREDFEAAMRALAELRPVLDAFFDKVTVNAEEPALRENRLKLLAMLRRATREVAEFSKIEG